MNGFKFSASNTVAVHFCSIQGVHSDPDLYLGGQRISCVESARFLGLTFDSWLTWIPHLKDLKVRCLRALDLLGSCPYILGCRSPSTFAIIHKLDFLKVGLWM